jgi:putative ABC transport system permease protein
MLKNYFSIAWRNLIKYRSLSAINIGGLVIGIASSILLLSYVAFESGYDGSNVNKKDIYRVDLSYYEDGKQVWQSAENYPALAPTLKKEIPEVQDAARLYNMGYKNNCVFTYNHHSFKETKFLYADASFLRMFTYPFVKGDAATALDQPFSAVISESLAKKIFGTEDPMGKPIKMNDDDRNAELCTVTGVFKDVPLNSHLQFNILISYNTLHSRDKERYESRWDRKDYYTYVLLRPGADPDLVQSRLAGVIDRHIPGEKAEHRQSVLTLEPLSRIHLTSGLADEPEVTVNARSISFLIIIAFFILTIGWINYINMTTAGAANRAKEVGVRKVLGSRRVDLVRQFLIESLAINGISVVLAILIVVSVTPFLDRQFQLHFDLLSLLQRPVGWALLIFFFIGSLLSGLYPAFVLSALKPVTVLKGKIKSAPSGLLLRKSLLVFQFALSVFLILGTAIVYEQVHYMLNKDLGMNIDQIVVLDRPGKWDTARSQHNAYVQRFAERLVGNPAIRSVGMSDELPGKAIRNPDYFRLKESKDPRTYPIDAIDIDDNFLSLLQLKFLAGRNFSRVFKTDKDGLVLTASAARQFGFVTPQEAIGKEVESDGHPYSVLGVVDDFHQLSLDKTAQPIIFYLINDAREFEYYLIKINGARASEAIEQIQASWNTAFLDNPFSFRFLNEDFNRQYNGVIEFERVFGAFALIAILISCIGLFSLLAFTVQQRTKEIGVRKVLGATVADIVLLLSRELLALVLLGNLIAWPLGWGLMNNWLTDFAYRVPVHFVLFLLSGAVALSIALVTIGIQSARAGMANPVRALRSE